MRRLTRGLSTLMPAFALVLLATPALGQGWIEPLPGRRDPGVVKVRTSVTVHVTDRIAEVSVEEWFLNQGGGLGEGDYIYPLPGEAVFSNFSLFQGDQELRGETLDANRARSIYEEIVRKKRDPALIELVGHGMVRARVFPINAGETRRITMRYTQVLNRAGDAVQFRYAAAGRFAGVLPEGRERGIGAQRVREDAPVTFMLIADRGDLFRDAFSPTHEVNVTRDGGHMTVRPARPLEGDFTLFLPFAERPVGLTLATHRPSGEDGWFMLTLSPGDVAASRVARDVTVVVDVSGSMSGEKIEQAKAALRQLVQSMGRDDRFRLIRFSSGVSTFSAGWTQATPQPIREAMRWIDDLRAEGGTNISGALEEAFSATSPETRLPVIVFMTDGLPSAGETNPERIAQMAEREAGRARVFAFGVGYDVNTVLLDRLGLAGRGSAQYVQPGEDVEQALGTLTARIQHPVLADLRIDGAPVRFEDVYPRTLPDLFAGEDLVIFGRYTATSRRSDASGDLTVAGQRNGRGERYTLRAVFPAHETGNDFIPRLWASRKIGALQQEVRLNGANPELVEEIRATALRYGLLSEYTSYLVQEPAVVMADGRLGALRLRPAAPASAATGQAAVVAAEQSRRSREAKTLDDVGRVQAAAMDRAVAGMEKNEAESVVTLAGRSFRQVKGEWRDAAWTEGGKVVTVEAWSDAYFALLRKLPELEPYWKQLDRVIVGGRAISIRTAPGGHTTMTAGELDSIVRDFRAK
jgi:Ca-activated chloride channel homolog